MVYHDSYATFNDADELMNVTKDKSEEMELQWLAPVSDLSFISESLEISKPFNDDDENTAITGDCSTDIFPNSSETLHDWLSNQSEISFESNSDLRTLSPQNTSSKAFTNNSFIFLPDDIRYDGLVEMSNSRNLREITLLPRNPHQVGSIFVQRSKHGKNHEDVYNSSPEVDLNLSSMQIEIESNSLDCRSSAQRFNEDDYWKTITDHVRHGNSLTTEELNTKAPCSFVEANNSNLTHQPVGGDKSAKSDAPASRTSFWEGLQEFLLYACFSCNLS
jgi:hypothetical protein